jgi:hypothetical protein
MELTRRPHFGLYDDGWRDSGNVRGKRNAGNGQLVT